MRRLLTAAVALSLGLTVLVPSVPAGHMAARVDAGAAHVSVDRPIPPEPVVVDAGSPGAAWTAKYGARPASYGLPASVLTAYLQAVAAAPPECHLSVSLLAAIGQVESGNLAGRLDDHNRAVPAILGPALDGHGTRKIADT